MSYDLLSGVRVLELALLGPDSLGGHLSDLGAEVIKIEDPTTEGDFVRRVGRRALGSPTGPSFLHLKWNRGKQSVGLNIKTPAGRELFMALVKESHVVIDGLRAGALERAGIEYEQILSVNPSIVICSLSGLGRTGPYVRLPTHGIFFDAYAGLLTHTTRDDGTLRMNRFNEVGPGLGASGLWAAMGTLAGVIQALRTGKGAVIEVAEAEVSVYWNQDHLHDLANPGAVHVRTGYAEEQDMAESVRHAYYATKDGRVILLQAIEEKFWDNLLRAIGREDLKLTYPPVSDRDHQIGEDGLRLELSAVFAQKTQEEWVDIFIREDICGGPVNSLDEVAHDRHFAARSNFYTVNQPEIGEVTLVTTPIKVSDEQFEQEPAPYSGQQTAQVLKAVLDLNDAALQDLASKSVISDIESV